MAPRVSSLFFKSLAVLAVLCGVACTPVTKSSETAIPLRKPTAQIASQADVTLDRLDGAWVIVSGAGVPVGARLVVSNGQARLGDVTLPLVALGQGRFRLGQDDIWVHWLDINNRTAALGEPGGKRVWIMDRTGQPGERLKAAREILEWYGYDLARLKRAS